MIMGMSLDFDVDLENNVYTNSPEKPHMSPDNKPPKTGEETNDTSPVHYGMSKPVLGRKEKRKKSASKPPRPPRGPSLDAADQKLIREIAELAMLKRARIERMRALKKSRAGKAASAASSLGNVLATLLTAIFFFVLVLQGLSPRAAASSGKSRYIDAGKDNGGFVSIQYAGNPTASKTDRPVLAQRFTNSVKPVEEKSKSNGLELENSQSNHLSV